MDNTYWGVLLLAKILISVTNTEVENDVTTEVVETKYKNMSQFNIDLLNIREDSLGK